MMTGRAGGGGGVKAVVGGGIERIEDQRGAPTPGRTGQAYYRRMGKIRHIAIRCEDPDGTARWLQAALEWQLVQRRGSGAIDLSDGDVNVTLLPLGLGAADHLARPGFEHIGVSVADDAAARQRLLDAGATELNPVGLGDVYYEAKFKSPEGLIIDVGHWAGTSPIPTSIEEAAIAGE